MIISPRQPWTTHGERTDVRVQVLAQSAKAFPVPGLVVEVDAEWSIVVAGPGVDSGALVARLPNGRPRRPHCDFISVIAVFHVADQWAHVF